MGDFFSYLNVIIFRSSFPLDCASVYTVYLSDIHRKVSIAIQRFNESNSFLSLFVTLHRLAASPIYSGSKFFVSDVFTIVCIVLGTFIDAHSSTNQDINYIQLSTEWRDALTMTR